MGDPSVPCAGMGAGGWQWEGGIFRALEREGGRPVLHLLGGVWVFVLPFLPSFMEIQLMHNTV